MYPRSAPPVTPEPTTTRRGAAEILGVTVVTIDTWIREGKLPAYRVGDTLVRIKVADVEAMLVPIEPQAAEG